MAEKKKAAAKKTSAKKTTAKKTSAKKTTAKKKTAAKKPAAKKPAAKKSTAKKTPPAKKADPEKKPTPDAIQVELISLVEMSAAVRMPPLQLRKLAQTGQIPAVKMDGEWRFNKELVRHALKRRSQGRR